MPPQPRLQALVLADHVYSDAQTGKKVIAGTYNTLWSRNFPGLLAQQSFAYVSLTDLRGRISLEIRYVDNTDLSVLIRSEPIVVESDSPLETLEIAIAIPPLPMPHAGTYSFELHANNERLGAVRVSANQLPGTAETPQ